MASKHFPNSCYQLHNEQCPFPPEGIVLYPEKLMRQLDVGKQSHSPSHVQQQLLLEAGNSVNSREPNWKMGNHLETQMITGLQFIIFKFPSHVYIQHFPGLQPIFLPFQFVSPCEQLYSTVTFTLVIFKVTTGGSSLTDVLSSNGSPTYCKQNVFELVTSELYL